MYCVTRSQKTRSVVVIDDSSSPILPVVVSILESPPFPGTIQFRKSLKKHTQEEAMKEVRSVYHKF
jgi:hypothetical protein